MPLIIIKCSALATLSRKFPVRGITVSRSSLSCELKPLVARHVTVLSVSEKLATLAVSARMMRRTVSAMVLSVVVLLV